MISLFVLIFGTIYYLIKPQHTSKLKFVHKPLNRQTIVITGMSALVVALFGFGSVLAATEPLSVKQARLAEHAAVVKAEQEKKKQQDAVEQERLRQIEAARPRIKVETKVEPVAFETVEQNDSAIPVGEKRVSVDGVNGERTITYDVTYAKGVEVARRETKNQITLRPTAKVILVGTYIKPVVPTPVSSGNGYINSQGNYVPSPSANPSGASAKCSDGTYSYSQNRRGTCSHHGGVAVWL